jgi:hypothetical protein
LFGQRLVVQGQESQVLPTASNVAEVLAAAPVQQADIYSMEEQRSLMPLKLLLSPQGRDTTQDHAQLKINFFSKLFSKYLFTLNYLFYNTANYILIF